MRLKLPGRIFSSREDLEPKPGRARRQQPGSGRGSELPRPIPKSTEPGDLGDLIEQVKDWQITHGSLIKLVHPPEGAPVLSRPIGVSVNPTPFSRRCFEEALGLQKPFNRLYVAVAEDEEWLGSALASLIATDAFTRRLWDIYQEVKRKGFAQPVTLGIFRSDYMLHQPQGTPISPDAQLKQVEFNTFSVAGGAHAQLAARMHRHLQRWKGLVDDAPLPRNDNIDCLVDGLAAAYAAYGEARSAYPLGVLFIVQPDNVNICDERPLEYALWEREPPIAAYRLEFGRDVLEQTLIGDHGALLYKRSGGLLVEISVVYMRAGYEAEDYDETGIAARIRLESSCAIKCPSILAHLATFKKVQQALTAPGAVERFLPAEEAAEIRKTFAPIYPLDSSEQGLHARSLATSSEAAVNHVLKPSLEGGGHNIYGHDIPGFLKSVAEVEWQNHVLMELILPPPVHGELLVSMRGVQQFYQGPIVSELGVFGIALWKKGADGDGDGQSRVEVLKNENAGWSFKTKAAHVNEISVAKGYGCFDCPLLEG